MKRLGLIGILFWAFSSVLSAQQATKAGADTRNAWLSFYAYDKQVPLDVLILNEQRIAANPSAVPPIPEHRRIIFSFMNTRDERVKGILWLPTSEGPHAVTLILHGRGGNKTGLFPQSYAFLLLKDGYGAAAIDAMHHGERLLGRLEMYGPSFYRLRDAYVQTVLDYRRLLDYIEQRTDIDPRRITLTGSSMGGLQGSLLAAVDTRIKCPVILVGGADIASGYEVTTNATWQNLRKAHPDLDFKKVADQLASVDPLNYVDLIAPRPLLMINARQDTVVIESQAKLLHETAKQPKQIIWIDSGHNLPLADTYAAILKWFKERL